MRTHARTYAGKVEAEFHIRSPLSKPGCRHIQAMFAMADTYIEPELRVRNVAFCRAFSTHTRAPSRLLCGKWRGRKSGVRNGERKRESVAERSSPPRLFELSNWYRTFPRTIRRVIRTRAHSSHR